MVEKSNAGPQGATHRYEHGGLISWYRETYDNLFVWRDGSWHGSAFKGAEELMESCPLGKLTMLGVEQAEPVEDDLTWLARNVHKWPESILDGTFRKEIIWIEPNREMKAAMVDNPLHCYSKPQWLGRRAELQSKPSWADAPPCAEYLGQGVDGGWTWFGREPEEYLARFDIGIEGFEECSGKAGEVLGDWRDTLEQRPADQSELAEVDTEFLMRAAGYNRLRDACRIMRERPDDCSTEAVDALYKLSLELLTKRDAAVCGGQKYLDATWHERGEYPPVGTECEIDLGSKWRRAFVVGHNYTGRIVVEIDTCDFIVADGCTFRPIRTERDELIDAIVSQGFLNRDGGVCGQVADAILAAGFKRGEA